MCPFLHSAVGLGSPEEAEDRQCRGLKKNTQPNFGLHFVPFNLTPMANEQFGERTSLLKGQHPCSICELSSFRHFIAETHPAPPKSSHETRAAKFDVPGTLQLSGPASSRTLVHPVLWHEWPVSSPPPWLPASLCDWLSRCRAIRESLNAQ